MARGARGEIIEFLSHLLYPIIQTAHLGAHVGHGVRAHGFLGFLHRIASLRLAGVFRRLGRVGLVQRLKIINRHRRRKNILPLSPLLRETRAVHPTPSRRQLYLSLVFFSSFHELKLLHRRSVRRRHASRERPGVRLPHEPSVHHHSIVRAHLRVVALERLQTYPSRQSSRSSSSSVIASSSRRHRPLHHPLHRVSSRARTAYMHSDSPLRILILNDSTLSIAIAATTHARRRATTRRRDVFIVVDEGGSEDQSIHRSTRTSPREGEHVGCVSSRAVARPRVRRAMRSIARERARATTRARRNETNRNLDRAREWER